MCANGNVRVTINGEAITLSAADAAKLVIKGGSGDDQVTIGRGVDGVNVLGGGGDDVIISRGEDTFVSAGAGSDRVRVYADGAVILGGKGNDNVYVAGDNARVNGGRGNDNVHVDGDEANVRGGRGRDRVNVHGDDARVQGGRGRDTLTVVGDNASVHGGRGRDVINVTGHDPRVTGGAGKDTINVTRPHLGRIPRPDADSGRVTVFPRPARDHACNHNEFIGRAREHIETGGGYAVVDSAMDGLEGMYGEIDQMLGGGKSTDATQKRLAAMKKESEAGIAELDKILNNPNLSFEDMIFMLMGALMKQSQNDVKGMTKQVREDKIAFDETKRQLTADVDAKEAKVLELEAKVRADPKDEGAAKQLGQAKSELRTAGEERNDKISDNNDSRQEQLEAIKNAMNKITEMQQALSNILNSMHQTAMNTIGNIR